MQQTTEPCMEPRIPAGVFLMGALDALHGGPLSGGTLAVFHVKLPEQLNHKAFQRAHVAPAQLTTPRFVGGLGQPVTAKAPRIACDVSALHLAAGAGAVSRH
jgi:hypothetical protein